MIDIEAFRASLGGDKDIEARLLNMFIECGDGVMAHLQANPESCEAQMHLLKGAALNLGAQRLADLAEEAGQMDAATREAGMHSVAAHYAELRSCIMAHLQQL